MSIGARFDVEHRALIKDQAANDTLETVKSRQLEEASITHACRTLRATEGTPMWEAFL